MTLILMTSFFFHAIRTKNDIYNNSKINLLPLHDSKYIFFRFRPHTRLGAHGFKIMYETQDCPDGTNDLSVVCSAKCSQTYHDRARTLTYPHNPGESSKRINCAYDIIQEQGSYIKIKDISLNLPCAIAFLEIRDGPHEDSPLIGRFCDGYENVPTNFASSQNHVVIRLVKSTHLQSLFSLHFISVLLACNNNKIFLTEYIQTIRIKVCWDSVYHMIHTLKPHQ